MNGPAFCAFLTQQAPRLKADGSPVGALADLTTELTSWVEKHHGSKPRTPADLDEASLASCPQTRTKVVASLGSDSFLGALG